MLRKARGPWVPQVSLQILSGIRYESCPRLCQGYWERTGSSVEGEGGAQLGEAQGQDRREVLATAQLRRVEDSCGHDRAQDAG